MKPTPFSLFYEASLGNQQRLKFRSWFGVANLVAFTALEFAYNIGPEASTLLSVIDGLGLTASTAYLGVNLINSRITVSKLFRDRGNLVKIQTYTMLGNVKQNSSEVFPASDLVFFRKGLKDDYFFVRVIDQKRVFRLDCNANTRQIETLFKFPQLGQNEFGTSKSREQIIEDRFLERKHNKRR
ncbi:hypothetical protein BASA81_010739 [Batrachochytrium salamandrivorans]|nr:hypothetical protein BASA81_010739 [Batrachochytrium salamandrivorans]